MLMQSKKFLATVAVLFLTALPLTAAPAYAAPCEGDGGGLGCVAEGENPGNDGGGNGDGGAGNNGNGDPNPDQPNDGQGGFNQGDGGQPPPVADTLPVAAQARDNVPYPVPELLTAPPNKSFVRMKTSFWIPDGIDEPPLTATAEVGAPEGVQYQQVTAYATVLSVEWHLFEDDDKVMTCVGKGRVKGEGPGEPCDYIFKYASVHEGVKAHHIEAIIHWKVHWICAGACSQDEGVFEDVPADPPAELELPIDEIQAEAN